MRTLFDLDHWLEVFQTLRRNRLRTALTAFGVFWGVLMLVVMLGFAKGLDRGARENFGSFAVNAVFVWPQQTVKAYAGRQPGRTVQLTLDDVEAVRTQVQGVTLALPRSFLGGRGSPNVLTHGDRSQGFPVFGEAPDYLQLETLDLLRGRFLDAADVDDHRKVAVIGDRVRDALFRDDEDPVGASVRLGNAQLTVVGVYKSPSSGGHGDWLNGRVFVPRTTVARMTGAGDRISAIAILVDPAQGSAEVEGRVKALLKQRHAVHPDDTGGFGAFNRAREFGKVQGVLLGIGALTWVVGVLTLLAGALGVSNIMMIAVAERTREIGIRKTVGATPFSIMAQIVTESTVLTALAGYLGLVAGTGVVELAGHLMASMPAGSGPSFFGRPEVELWIALLCAGVLTVTGALAGLAPARSAVAVRPVEALAHE